MQRYERVIKTIHREPTDYTPYHIDFTSVLRKKTGKALELEEDMVEHSIGNHLLQFNYTPGSDFVETKPSPTSMIDEFGVTWDSNLQDKGDWNMSNFPLKQPDHTGFTWPDPYKPGRFDHLPELIKGNPDRAVVMLTAGYFDLAWHTTGLQNMLMYMMTDKKFVNSVLDHTLEFMLGIIDQLPEGVHGCRFTGDMGLQKGTMISVEMWREFLKPRERHICDKCHKKGLFIINHSCGDNIDLIPEYIDVGFDVFDPLQPEVMDVEYVKREFGKDIVLLGGISCQDILPKGSPDDVREHVKRTWDLLAHDGGYILSTAGSMPTDVPVENVISLIKTCQEITPEY